MPELLRRLADSIESMGAVSVQDIAFHTEVTEAGPWHSMTVYFHEGDAYEDSDDADHA